jgi:hypothetical protein
VIAAASFILRADWTQSTPPSDIGDASLVHIFTVIASLQFNTHSDAQHVEVAHHLPYRQRTRALSTTDIRISHRSTLVHIDFPKQGPFCSPHEKIAPVDDELFAKTLQFKLWMLAQELEAIGEIESVYLVGIEAPTPETDIETRRLDTIGKGGVSNKDNDEDQVPSIWRMHKHRRA